MKQQQHRIGVSYTFKAYRLCGSVAVRVISTLAGIETTVQLRPLLTKGLHLVGSMLRNRTPEFKAYILSELVKNVWPKIEDGTIKPSIYKVLPMEKAAEAHGILERGENVGKVVLTL